MELKIALRLLARNPPFSLMIILTLALAVGANAAVFSVLDGVVLKAMPYPQADRLAEPESGRKGRLSGSHGSFRELPALEGALSLL